jgi:hypothetical protein
MSRLSPPEFHVMARVGVERGTARRVVKSRGSRPRRFAVCVPGHVVESSESGNLPPPLWLLG